MLRRWVRWVRWRRRRRQRKRQLWRARILVLPRSPLVAFVWATLFLLAVFGAFQGASGRRSSCPESARPSSDLGRKRRGVRGCCGGAGGAAAAVAVVGARGNLCGHSPLEAFCWAPSSSSLGQ
jgi:hypothetical protein